MRLRSLIALAVLLTCSSVVTAQGLQLRLVSNPRPEFVSGGDVLVSVSLPAGIQLSPTRLTLNGTDVTSTLRADTTGRTLMALVKGLTEGSNALVASAGEGNAEATGGQHPGGGAGGAGPHPTPLLFGGRTCITTCRGAAGREAGGPCSVGTRAATPVAASTPSTPESLPGTTGTPAPAIRVRAPILSAICWMTDQDGPTNTTPASSHALANRQFSDRNP